MKLTAFILIFFGLHVSAKTASQSVTLSGNNLTLSTVFATIEKQTGYIALFSKDAIKVAKPVTVNAVNQSLDRFLLEVFKDQPLQFTINNTSIVVNRKKEALIETAMLPFGLLNDSVPSVKITGTVLGFNGQLLAGATIRIKGKSSATTSNSLGAFEVSVEAGKTLVVSYAGYVTAEKRITNSQNIVIQLESSSVLEEAVVYNGYQKIKQAYLTGSVTSLKMDSIIQPGLSTIDKMLEGRVPGMMFMQNSGQAGAAPKLRIRGTSTILGSREPLWVVDGIVRTNPIPIPADRVNDPDFVNLVGNAISGLNPYDIDQIDVLKDATAAAQYGVRGANGVIVITTKRGKPGPPTLNYNATGTYTRRPRYTDGDMFMMNSRERVDVSREMIEKKMTLRGGALEAYERAIAAYYSGELDYNDFKQLVDKAETMNTDWLGIIMQDKFATNHTLSVTGGSPNASYRVSLGYQPEPGVIRKERSDRYTGAMNLLLNYRKFKADVNVQMNKEQRRYTPQGVGVMNYAYGTNRAIPLYNEDGSLYYYSTVSSAVRPANSLYDVYDFKTMNIHNEIDHTGETIVTNDYSISGRLTYEIMDGLQLNSTLGYTNGSSEQKSWFEEQTEMAAQIKSAAWDFTNHIFRDDQNPLPYGGELSFRTVQKQNYSANAQIDFMRYLDQRKKHHLSATLGAEMTSTGANNFSQTNRGYYPNRGYSFATMDIVKFPSYGRWLQSSGAAIIQNDLQNSLRSYITGTYVLNDRYILSAVTSQEFSNAFGSRSNEKFLPTWAISARWNMYDDLFTHSTWVDQAALRLSYGTQGNMQQGQTPYTIIQRGPLNTDYNAYSSTIISYPNPDLSWEKKEDYSANIDFSFMNGRIRGTVGAFYNKTSNAFMDKKVSAINGVNSYVVNGGTLENYGMEIDLHFRIINQQGAKNKKGFMWRFDPQIGQAINKLLNNNLNSRNVLVDMAGFTYSGLLNGAVPLNGRAVNTFYSYRFKSLDHNYGYPVFYGAELENAAQLTKEYNALTKEELYTRVMVESGRREPVLQGGVSNTFSYRGWSLDVNFTYSIGNKIRLLQIASGNYGTFRPSSQQNLRKEFVNRWRYPGDELHTNIPAIQGISSGATTSNFENSAWWEISTDEFFLVNKFANNYYDMYDFSDLRVVKGDYLKLQYVSLQYMVPQNYCKKLGVKGVSMRFSGNNLFTIANKALRGQDPSISGSASNINLSIRPVYAFNINLSF